MVYEAMKASALEDNRTKPVAESDVCKAAVDSYVDIPESVLQLLMSLKRFDALLSSKKCDRILL